MKINNEWQVKNNQQEVVPLFEKFIAQLANKLPTKVKPFFMSLIPGALLAIARRRTATQCLRAAQISDDYRQAFYHMPNIGRKGDELFNATAEIVLEQLGPVIIASSKIRLVLDDLTAKRYGRKIEGAGWHHNPTPGRTDAKTCFGHSWVVAVGQTGVAIAGVERSTEPSAEVCDGDEHET